MKKNLGFTRFEFYFVISAISIITLFAIQRYLTLAEETRHFSVEMIVRNFSAVIYNHHARWIMAQQNQSDASQLNIDGVDIQFSQTGWPVAVLAQKNIVSELSITSCLSLWQNFLQNPPLISVSSDAYGTQAYHLSLPKADTCRYEFVNAQPNEFYVDYKPISGEFIFHTLPFIQK